MNKKRLEDIFTWFQEHNAGQHVTFGSMLVYILSVTGLALSNGIGFLVLNVLSGLWLIFRLYQSELLPLSSKDTEGMVTAIMTPNELREMVRGIMGPEPESILFDDTGEAEKV